MDHLFQGARRLSLSARLEHDSRRHCIQRTGPSLKPTLKLFGHQLCWPDPIDWVLLFVPKRKFEFLDEEDLCWRAIYKEWNGKVYVQDVELIIPPSECLQ